MRKAREPGSALVHEHWGDNVFLESFFEVDITQAFDAPIKVSHEISTARQCMSPMEGRGVVATFDHRLDQLTLYTGAQMPHIVRNGLAECLGLAQERIRIIAPDVGGGFGWKGLLQAEEVVLRVRDNGVGIAAVMLPRIFDLFVQAHDTLDRAEGGLGAGMRGGVDDPGTAEIADRAGKLPLLVVIGAHPGHRERDVRPVEVTDHDRRVTQAEPLHDFRPHGRRRGGGQRQPDRCADRVRLRSQQHVVRPEVVTPLADQVRLVDHEQTRPRPQQRLPRLAVRELFGREVRLGGPLSFAFIDGKAAAFSVVHLLPPGQLPFLPPGQQPTVSILRGLIAKQTWAPAEINKGDTWWFSDATGAPLSGASQCHPQSGEAWLPAGPIPSAKPGEAPERPTEGLMKPSVASYPSNCGVSIHLNQTPSDSEDSVVTSVRYQVLDIKAMNAFRAKHP